ncbi:hypothetical protein LRH25_18760 [Ideonella azotifigens]|uniref:Uncharacterized protein n=1 Tax=Ideonella azotifigens TaxID=513160 RepID=A0ABP3VHH3_9BURK|nr:hypothetical protein [Ideonella azotifigens]MCD2342373.1 hypothetical protein [Ideonella azotifigens]
MQLNDPAPWREAAQAFWAWLFEHQAELDALRSPDDVFWDELLLRLQALDDGLWFEVSSAEVSPRELVITAQGDVDLFDKVETLVALASPLTGWRVVALKPPLGFDFGIRYQGIELQPAELWFQPLLDEDAPHMLGLRIAVPGFIAEMEEEFDSGVLIVLDTALGERAAATEVELLEVCELPAHPPEEGFFPLPELLGYLAWRQQQMRPGQGGSGQVH